MPCRDICCIFVVDGILYEMDEEEQIEKLIEVGFDVSLIGLDAPEKNEEGDQRQGPGSGPDGDILDDDLPF